MLCLLLGWAGLGYAQAQSAQFAYTQSTVASGLSGPNGVAVDSAGNVYITEIPGVLKETLSGGTYTQSTIGAGLNDSSGVAVDSAGNVYIAASNYGLVVKETLSGGTYTQSTILSDFMNPAIGVAVDNAGSVYISGTTGDVLKETLSGSTYTQSIITSIPTDISGVAVDSTNNVYVAESSPNSVLKETLSGGSSYSQSTAVTGLPAAPAGVAVDSTGDVYIAVPSEGTVVKETLSGGTYSIKQAPMQFGLSQPEGVAVDSAGNVYIADSGTNTVVEDKFGAVNFGSVPVGTKSGSITLVFDVSGAKLGAPVALTQGAAGLDFADAGTGTCNTKVGGAAFSGECTVNVTFAPKYAGQRDGAVELTNSTGAVIATAYVYGTGTGPQVVFNQSQASANVVAALASGFSELAGVTVDGDGNLYATAANSAMASVAVEIPEGCTAASCVKALGGGFSEVEDVALDGAGNVYVADSAGNAIKKIPPGCASASCVETLGGGFEDPFGLAVDESGNVYVADTVNFAVKEIPASCISGANNASCVKTLGGGFKETFGVAVDGSGNVYVTDPSNQAIKEIPANCIVGANDASCVKTIGGGFNDPYSVAVDASGNVYATDLTGLTATVKEIPAGCTSANCVETLGSGFNNLTGIAVDGNGNIFVDDDVNNAVDGITRATPPALSFATTGVGSTSSAQTVTVQNIGNAPLAFPIPSAGNNPSVAANFTWDDNVSGACGQTNSASATAFTLAAGASCNVGIDFAPTAAGSASGSAVLTDTNLNAAAPTYATQTINLSGTAIQITLTPAAGALPAATLGTAYSDSFAGSGGAGPYTFGSSDLPSWLTLSSTGTLSGTPTAAGSYSFTVTATDANAFSDTENYTLTVNKAPLTVTANNATRAYGAANPAFTGNVTGAVNSDTFSTSYSTSATTTSNAGTYAIVPSVTGANLADYTVTTTNGTLTVTQLATTTTLSANATTVVLGQSLTLTAQVAASANGSGTPTGTVSFYAGTTLLGTGTLSGGTASFTTTPSASGTLAFSASYAGDVNFAGSATAPSAVSVPVQSTSASFSMSATGDTMLITHPGNPVTYTFQVSPTLGNYPGPVTFTASGLPPGATATFSPATIPANGGAQTVTMTIQTVKPGTSAKNNNPFDRGAPLALAFLCFPLLGFRRIRKTKLGRSAMVVLLLIAGTAGVASLSGCGSAGMGRTAYNITVTATSQGGAHTANVTLFETN